MRDLSCLTKEQKDKVKDWLAKGALGCPFKSKVFTFDPTCTKTCGKVFPECVEQIEEELFVWCPCGHLGKAFVIKELTL